MDALARLLAWRLDLAHVDPLSTLTVDLGRQRALSRRASPVLLRAVSGHRDTGLTDVPRASALRTLVALAATGAALGLPKIYAPLVDGRARWRRFASRRRRLRRRCRGRSRSPTQAGATVASGERRRARRSTGRGTRRCRCRRGHAGRSTSPARRRRPARSALRAGRDDARSSPTRRASPATISPNGDGAGGRCDGHVHDRRPATVDGHRGRRERRRRRRAAATVERAAPGRTRWRSTATVLADGAYVFASTRRGRRATVSRTCRWSSRARSGASPSRPPRSTPNGDGRADRLTMTVHAAQLPPRSRVRVLRDGKWVATPFAGDLAAGPRTSSAGTARKRARHGCSTGPTRPPSRRPTRSARHASTLPFVVGHARAARPGRLRPSRCGSGSASRRC